MSRSPDATSPFEVLPPEGAPYSPIRRLLGEYALAWARAALRGGAAPSAEGAPALALLDPFAGADHPASPSLAARLLRAAAALLARRGAGAGRAWLADEDPVKVEWVREAVGRIPGSGAAGIDPEPPLGVDLREADAAGMLDAAAGALSGAGAALALLDPPAARRLPWATLLAPLRAAGVDLLLRFPAGDVRRLARYRGMPLADLPPFARRTAEGLSALLGDVRHGWLQGWSATLAAEGQAAAERGLVAALAARLAEVDGVVVRVVALPPGAPADGPEHLLLATRSPERALLLNEVLFAARQDGWLPWPAEDGPLVRHEPRAELELFGRGAAAACDRVVDGVEVAHSIATRFAGRTVPLDVVVESLLDSDLFLEDVRRALAALRRDGRALYRSLAAGSAEIAFPRRRAPRSGPRALSRRRTDAQEALFPPLDPERGPDRDPGR